MIKKLFAGLILTTVVVMPSHAAITIGALTQLCGYDAQGRELAPSAHASCQSYMAGIIDYHDLFRSVGKTTPSIDFCLPQTITYTDLQRVVLEYLQSHSSFADSPAASAVVIALHNDFPCANSMAPLTAADDQATEDFLYSEDY